MFGKRKKNDGEVKVNFKDYEHKVFSDSDDVEKIIHQEFISDLEDHKFAKIDEGAMVRYDDEANAIVFKNINEKSKYYNEEASLLLEDGELDVVLRYAVAVKEGLFYHISLECSDVKIEMSRSITGVYNISVSKNKDIFVSMVSREPGLYKRFIYFLLYSILYK